MNLILIGGRGTGKSTISQALAKKLSWPLLSVDALMEERAGKSIPEIVKSDGWSGFRNMEFELFKELSQKDEVVIDAGGGVMVDLDEDGKEVWSERKVNALKANGKMILLTASVETQAQRIDATHHRPSLTGETDAVKEIGKVMERRKEWYEKAADYVVSTEGKGVETCVEEILKFQITNSK